MDAHRSWYCLARLDALPQLDPWAFRLAGRVGLVTPRDGAHVAELERRPIPTCTHAGFLFAWFCPAGTDPDFTLPPDPFAAFDGLGAHTTWDLPMQPARVMHDLVDPGHFATVHGYAGPSYRVPPTFDGPTLTMHLAFGWDTGLPGALRSIPADANILVRGVGYQRTEVHSMGGRFTSMHLVLPTPLDAHTTRLHTVAAARMKGRLGRGLLGRIANPLATELIRFAEARDIGRDARMWADAMPGYEFPESDDVQAFHAWTDTFLSPRAEAA